MRQLRGVFEGLLDSDFDGVDVEAMPKVGQTIIDLWSKVKKHNDICWWYYEGWVVDYGEFLNIIGTTHEALKKINKNHIGKGRAQTLVRSGGGNPDADVCLICLGGHPVNAQKTLGICRPSTHEGIFFKTTYDRNGEPCGFIYDTLQQSESRVGKFFRYMEGRIDPGVWRQYWAIPGYCFDVIKRKIIK